jgi:hypothetical protein
VLPPYALLPGGEEDAVMPSRNRQKARNKPHACVRRRLASAGGFVGTETKRAWGDATGSGWRKRWYSLVWVNRKRVFNDAAMIKRHVIGTVFFYIPKRKISLYVP